MNYTCISDFTYLDSPEFVSLAYHILNVFEAPIHCLGFYCILFKTPAQMRSVKWYLFTLHAWILIFDFTLNLFTTPYIFTVEAAGYTLGLSTYTNIPMVIQFDMAICFGTYMLISIVSIFEHRFYIICTFSWKQSWMFWRRFWLGAHYVVLLILLCIIPFLVPDQEVARRKLFKKLPCLPKYLYEAPILVLADDKTFLIISGVFFIALLCLETLLFLTSLFLNTAKQVKENTMSRKTFQLQMRFIITLLIQVSIPLICFILPLVYTLIVVLIDYFNQEIINILMLAMSSHGIVSTIAMLLLHKPYRHAIKELWHKSVRKPPEVSVQSIGSNIRNNVVARF